MREIVRLGLLGVLLTMLALPAAASDSTVEINGERLTAQEGWVEGGTSYVTLRGLSRVLGADLVWLEDSREAVLSGDGFTLVAPLGQCYILVNDRALYLAGGVQAPQGITQLPLRLVSNGLNGIALWDEENRTASLTTGWLDESVASYDGDDLYWLSRIISAESRGESLEGQIGVGNVVLNRVACLRYPDNIYGVIFDRNYGVQFEPVINGTVYDEPTDQCVVAAKLALEGTSIVGDALYFFAPALSPGTWIRENTTYLMTIGCHQFYID